MIFHHATSYHICFNDTNSMLKPTVNICWYESTQCLSVELYISIFYILACYLSIYSSIIYLYSIMLVYSIMSCMIDILYDWYPVWLKCYMINILYVDILYAWYPIWLTSCMINITYDEHPVRLTSCMISILYYGYLVWLICYMINILYDDILHA